MTSPALLLFVPLLGVSFGYEPSSDAEVGYDYTVQVEPELLEQMKAGEAEAIEANIPPEVSPIRRIRVVVGNQPLAKKLRPGAVARTTYRPELGDAASPSVDLLAQTGPAGGFGRNADGFNGAATRASSQPNATSNSIPNTVPPAGTQYTGGQYSGSQYTAPPTNPMAARTTNPPAANGYDTRNQLEAGFEAAENGFNNTRNAVRNSLSEMGATGERVINDTRQAVGDLIAPPDTRSAASSNNNAMPNPNLSNPANTPLAPLSGGTGPMPGFVAPTTAARSNGQGMDRYGNPVGGAGGNVNSQPRATVPTPDWNADSGSNPLRVSERSVLSSHGNSNATANTPIAETQEQYWARVEREQRERELQTQADLAAVRGRQPAPPGQEQFPAKEAGGATALPSQNGTRTGGPNIVAPMVSDGAGIANARGPESAEGPAITAANNPSGQSPAAAGDNSQLPSLTPTSQTAQRANFDSDFGGIAERASFSDTEDRAEADNNTGVPPAIWAWGVALAAALLNAWQWVNMVDLRNKYRVALRRSSPNFARSMAA